MKRFILAATSLILISPAAIASQEDKDYSFIDTLVGDTDKEIYIPRYKAVHDLANIKCIGAELRVDTKKGAKKFKKIMGSDYNTMIKDIVDKEPWVISPDGKKIVTRITGYKSNFKDCAGEEKYNKTNISGIELFRKYRIQDTFTEINKGIIPKQAEVKTTKNNQSDFKKVTPDISARRKLAAEKLGSFICILSKNPTKGKVPDRSSDLVEFVKSATLLSTEETNNLIDGYLKTSGIEDQFDWLNSKDGVKVVFAFADFYTNFPKCYFETSSKIDTKKIVELNSKYIKPVKYLIERQTPSTKEKEPSNYLKKIFSGNKSDSVNSKDNSIRKKCLKAADYAGCMEYEKSQE